MYGVNRITVRKAIDELQNEKYLIKRQGKGTFVQRPSIEHKLKKMYSFGEMLKEFGKEEKYTVTSFTRILPVHDVQAALRLLPSQEVFCVERLRFIDDSPYACETSFIPVHFVPNLTQEQIQQMGLYRSLNSHGIYLDHATESFSAVNLSRENAKKLLVDYRDAAINLIRIASQGTDVIEYCQSIVRGDVFHYSVDLV